MLNWMGNHWAVIALCASEILALVPVKYNGIAQAVFNILGKIANNSLKKQ